MDYGIERPISPKPNKSGSASQSAAEWSLNAIQQPIGVSEYQFPKAVKEEILKKLPSIETIENELMKNEK